MRKVKVAVLMLAIARPAGWLRLSCKVQEKPLSSNVCDRYTKSQERGAPLLDHRTRGAKQKRLREIVEPDDDGLPGGEGGDRLEERIGRIQAESNHRRQAAEQAHRDPEHVIGIGSRKTSVKSNRPEASPRSRSSVVRERQSTRAIDPVEDPDPDPGSDLFFRIGATPAGA